MAGQKEENNSNLTEGDQTVDLNSSGVRSDRKAGTMHIWKIEMD